MEQPQGFIDSAHPDYDCLLHKSLYELKQEPRAWFEKFSNTLLHMGFKHSSYVPSLFLHHHQDHITLILIYVDDLIVTGSDSAHIQSSIAYLKSQFAIRDLGDIHYFLDIEATRHTYGLILSQTKYLTYLLHKTNMLNCKPCLTPMTTTTQLTQHDPKPCADPNLYRSLVGALQYAILTRLDLAYSVNKVSQFMHQPTENHWCAVK
jgi:Reverse transcriptase (RNA-dependent DNA polymerase)